MHIDETIRPS